MLLLGVLAAQAEGAVAGAGSYDLLETEILTGSQASVTFSSLNSTYGADYQHLQLRIAARDNRGISGTNNTLLQFNADTGSNYRERHVLRGNGSSVSSFDEGQQSRIIPFSQPSGSDTADVFNAAVIDILDAFNTNKYTTTRTLRGVVVSGTTGIALQSGLWMNTNALTSIELEPVSASYVTGSRFSLYGLRSA